GDTRQTPLRYWRGPGMWDFHGRSWSTGPTPLADFTPLEGVRGRYRYGVVLEAHNRIWLFALETASTLPERARYTADGHLLARSPLRARMRYDLVSVIAPAGLGTDEDPAALRRALRRPPGL